jgi:hypothetical protein
MARKILEGVVAYANNKSTPVVPYDVKLQDANAMADTTNPNSNQNKNNQTNTNNNKNTSKNKILPSDLEYVVNGEIKTKEEVDKISSNNIATMQVLKDNDFAKSIYNVKGKQAVIIITTKDYKPEIVIRSATENIPLYIVDGTAMSAEEAKKIDPNNIFSVNVLKGDDAIKAYGEKGKYGVVEITTKGVTKKGNGIMINTGFEAQKIVLLAKPKEKC